MKLKYTNLDYDLINCAVHGWKSISAKDFDANTMTNANIRYIKVQPFEIDFNDPNINNVGNLYLSTSLWTLQFFEQDGVYKVFTNKNIGGSIASTTPVVVPDIFKYFEKVFNYGISAEENQFSEETIENFSPDVPFKTESLIECLQASSEFSFDCDDDESEELIDKFLNNIIFYYTD